jgi:hypothetical protein
MGPKSVVELPWAPFSGESRRRAHAADILQECEEMRPIETAAASGWPRYESCGLGRRPVEDSRPSRSPKDSHSTVQALRFAP